jgi:hypothetical protein
MNPRIRKIHSRKMCQHELLSSTAARMNPIPLPYIPCLPLPNQILVRSSAFDVRCSMFPTSHSILDANPDFSLPQMLVQEPHAASANLCQPLRPWVYPTHFSQPGPHQRRHSSGFPHSQPTLNCPLRTQSQAGSSAPQNRKHEIAPILTRPLLWILELEVSLELGSWDLELLILWFPLDSPTPFM